MTKARTLANFISDNNEFADGTISVSEVSGAAPLASPTFTGTTTVSGDFNVFNNTGSSSSYDFKSDHYAQLKLTSDVDASAGGPYEIMFTANGSNGKMELRTNNVEYLGIDQSGKVVINEGGVDADFRVESNNNTNMIKVDAAQDNIGIGKSPGSGQGTLQTVSSAAAVNYYRPAGRYHIFGESSGNGNTEWIYLGGSYTDTDKSVGYVMQDYNGNFGQYAGSYIRSNQAKVRIGHFVGGANSGTAPSLADNFIFDTGGGAVFNERGENGDFRVESDTNANMLFVDASSNVVTIGNSSGAHDTATKLQVAGRVRFGSGFGSETSGMTTPTNSMILTKESLSATSGATRIYGLSAQNSGYSPSGDTAPMAVLLGGWSNGSSRSGGIEFQPSTKELHIMGGTNGSQTGFSDAGRVASFGQTQVVFNGGTQSYSDNYRMYAAIESLSFTNASAGGTDTFTSSIDLPYQRTLPVVVALSYIGNGAISYNVTALVHNGLFAQGATVLQTVDSDGGAIMGSVSLGFSGSYNTRKLTVTITTQGTYAPDNWDGSIFYGVAIS